MSTTDELYDYEHRARLVKTLSYQYGHAEGRTAGLQLLQMPVDGSKAVAYFKIHECYAHAITSTDPFWQGYAEGVDEVAREAGYSEPTDEQIDRFYEEL